MHMNLSELRETEKDKEAWRAAGFPGVEEWDTAERQKNNKGACLIS